MEVRKVNTPSVPYQGSGPEVAVKLETAVKQEPVISSAVPKTEKKAAPRTAVSDSPVISEEEKQNPVDSNEMKKKSGMKRAVEEINRKAKNSEVIFGIHDATNRVTIKVVDKGTKEVIREFPPEETLDMIAKVWELAGIMIDERG
ncbi:flagellar protein FlaG [Petralouisia muris]|uniref:Flagellar protein FlaG n=1 Tax=Petralouisia muris TaxID=3032872 RepID=A0AC61RTU9_9FIRM|nr:flagellar protein FlaG [Petralouisia muris]TGY95143.1 flagellar protein FlaG [Petralouisia muris]